ncbi:DUF1989 domain-containing protein [Nocardioides sp. cx-173]|uniref:DUF1989 domain-containing protein n=1 Tax=Nocardioides sp. cx-173 TaxID=2898796 RepID=UPI001E2B0CCA|nr:DUF1989 domain-containing protein [Nocardioides sp. cx-173]MCD4525464.1 DUF1989 domain-containing protein [Nocardioides sp. cx-173]UGB42610.1 DUF1989 domain-containing protein [Nocardioides sp. cx-173]
MTVTIPHATAQAFPLEAGQRLTVTMPAGDQGGDLTFVGFDPALTRNINGWATHRRPVMLFHVAAGMSLYDGEGSAILRVEEIRGEQVLDVVMPGCYREVYPDRRPGCRDLTSAALGLTRGHLTGMASFGILSTATDEYYDALSASANRPGDSLTLLALMPTVVAVSACPDTDIPGWRPGELHVEIS